MNQKIKVMLVDDEKEFRLSTQKILRRRGFETILTGSGEEAVEKLGESPQVIILDIKMPGMDGLEALREIKAKSPDVPVIMLTGHGSEDAAKEALEQGAQDFLAKPCDIDLLCHKLMEAVRQHNPAGGNGERRVKEVMVPLSDYTTVGMDATVEDAIAELRRSFSRRTPSDSIMETGHRSVLIIGPEGAVRGLLSIKDLMEAVMPAYLSAPKPVMADSIQYSPMFWRGMFSNAIKDMARQTISQMMSPAPSGIDADASLMEAAYLMLKAGERRLLVMESGQVAGVIREQDLFFEMNRILGN